MKNAFSLEDQVRVVDQTSRFYLKIGRVIATPALGADGQNPDPYRVRFEAVGGGRAYKSFYQGDLELAHRL